MDRKQETIFIAGLAIALSIVGIGQDEMKRSALAVPAAKVAAVMLGAELNCDAAQNPVISAANCPITVVPSCSGYDFLCLVFAFLAISWKSLPGLTRCAAAVPIALAVTVTVNAMRIVALFYVHTGTGGFLPERFFSGVHLLTGCAVFLCGFAALSALVMTRGSHASR